MNSKFSPSVSLGETINFSHFNLLRGFAAIIVVFFHLNGDTGGRFLPSIAGLGWIGVDIFFVISGAVISLSAEQLYTKEKERWGKLFWQRRLARIYPLYFFSICVFTFLFLNKQTLQDRWESSFQFISHLFMLHSYFPWTWQGLLGPTWSLAIEMQFYFLIWLVWPWLRHQNIWVIMATSLLCTYLWHSYFIQTNLIKKDQIHFFLSQLPGRLDEFTWGFLIFYLTNNGIYKNNRISFFRYLGFGLIFLGGFLSIAWYQAISGDTSVIGKFGMKLHLTLGDAGVRLLLGVCVFFIVWGCSLFKESWLSLKISWLGTISYGLYLLHSIVILFLSQKGMIGHSLIWNSLLITLLLATLSYYILEKPIIKYFKRSLPRFFSGTIMTQRATTP